jgi:hypothetical protein
MSFLTARCYTETSEGTSDFCAQYMNFQNSAVHGGGGGGGVIKRIWTSNNRKKIIKQPVSAPN